MHTYKKKDEHRWYVGYYTMEANYNQAGGGMWHPGGGVTPTGPAVVSVWQFVSEHGTEQEAMERVNYLNGGSIIV